ncbi:MAG: hypothetical protein HY303_01970 [Candidatus Wallbacteria bacterium]|nr:hypothetical protein [Candidatus Wallbacteria bacterium]
MFSRKLKPDEQALLQRIENLVHGSFRGGSADPPQAMEVLRIAVAVGAKVSEPVNPIVLTASALLYRLATGLVPPGPAGGFVGASVSEAFLRSTNLSERERVQIVRAVSAVASPEFCVPETAEERIVADAVDIEGFGMMGTLRALRLSDAGLGTFIKDERVRRKARFDALHFDASREIGQTIYQQGDVYLKTVEKAYHASASGLKDAALPA